MAKLGAFLTVAYPQALPYLGDVCKSALEQTRKDFDILIVNDGCERKVLKNLFKGLSTRILDAEGGFSANRMQGINYARNHHYSYLLFCDADDTFTYDRYERTLDVFEESQADIIVSNVNLVDEHCEVMIKDYFSSELPESRWIESDFINDKNIFGMSNTAICLDTLRGSPQIPETQIVDWYFFTSLLLGGLRARYISDSLVNYRQHSANMIGINEFEVASFRRLAILKHNHYKLLIENGYSQYQLFYQDSKRLLDISDIEIERIIRQGLASHPQPLWWQIITGNND